MKVLNPKSHFSAWGFDKGATISRESDLEGQWHLIIGLPQDWGKQTPVLKDRNKILPTPRPRGEEQWPQRRLNRNSLLVLEGLLWSVGQQGLATGMGALAAAVQEAPLAGTPSRIHHWLYYRAQGRVSGQTTTREGVQHHPSADNWIKALLSKALPTEQDPVFPTSSLSHQEAYTSHRLHHQRVDRRSKKNHSPTANKTKTILISMKKQKVMSQMKG